MGCKDHEELAPSTVLGTFTFLGCGASWAATATLRIDNESKFLKKNSLPFAEHARAYFLVPGEDAYWGSDGVDIADGQFA